MMFALLLLIMPAFVHAAGAGPQAPDRDWQFEGLPASWDKDQLYRGYQVATQLCMACHSFKYIKHRQLADVGFTEAEIRALSEQSGYDKNDPLLSGLSPADAKEIYGKEMPDLSLMNRARAGGADYVYALLTGYSDDPDVIAKYFPDGMPMGAYYNEYYPGHAIAMPNPLTADGLVEYHDGTEATVEQMAEDVTYFMQWTAEPELVERKRLGVYVLIYLLIFTVLAYFLKRSIWRDVK